VTVFVLQIIHNTHNMLVPLLVRRSGLSATKFCLHALVSMQYLMLKSLANPRNLVHPWHRRPTKGVEEIRWGDM